jgi:hypothetical protein
MVGIFVCHEFTWYVNEHDCIVSFGESMKTLIIGIIVLVVIVYVANKIVEYKMRGW